METGNRRQGMVFAAMCGLNTSLGMLTNVPGVFFVPIAEDLGVGRGSVALTLTISNLAFALAGMFTARLMKAMRLRQLVALGTAVNVAATAALALVRAMPLLYLLNALRGLAVGAMGLVLMTVVLNNWFQRNNSLITSVVLSCSGVAGVALSPVLSALIQGMGWRMTYVVVAGIILALNLPALLLPISLSPEAQPPREGFGERDEKKRDSANGRGIVPGFVPALAFSLFGALLTAFPQHLPALALSHGLSESMGSLMLSLCMAANVGGKLLLGFLADHIGARKSILFYGLLLLFASWLLRWTSVSALGSGSILLGLSYGMITVGLVAFTRECFGLNAYERVFPALNLGTAASNALGASLFGFLYDFTGTYALALNLVSVAIVVASLALLTAYRCRKRLS